MDNLTYIEQFSKAFIPTKWERALENIALFGRGSFVGTARELREQVQESIENFRAMKEELVDFEIDAIKESR